MTDGITYATEVRAQQRQTFLAREYGIFSGIRQVGDRWELVYDPELVYPTGIKPQLRDEPVEYVEDMERFPWLPPDD